MPTRWYHEDEELIVMSQKGGNENKICKFPRLPLTMSPEGGFPSIVH